VSAILIPTGSEAEWLAARRQGITASEIAIVMGLSPYSSPFALYHQKLGQLPDVEETDAMQLGSYMESFIAERFAERHPDWYIHGDGRELYAHPDQPWQMATPDRLVYEAHRPQAGRELAVLECKIDGGSDEWGEDGTDQIPVHYRCQVLWQMDVMGVTAGYVACLLWNRRKVRVYELAMDGQAREDLRLMRGQALLFLERIDLGDEPDVDWRPSTTGALKTLHPLITEVDVPVRRMPVIQYRAACKAYKAAEQRKKLAENKLRQLLGDGHRVVDARSGELVATRQVYDVKEHVRKKSTTDKLVPAKAKQ